MGPIYTKAHSFVQFHNIVNAFILFGTSSRFTVELHGRRLNRHMIDDNNNSQNPPQNVTVTPHRRNNKSFNLKNTFAIHQTPLKIK